MILPDGTSQPEPSQNHFPGTGVRFLASLIDWAIIFLFAVIIGGGEASLWLVDVISQLYFTLGFGPVFAGRTVGKRLLTLKVVGTNGTPPSSAKAAVRSLPFALLPAVLSLAGLGVTSLMASPYSLAISLSLAASWVVTVYASVRLHPQRRGLHDLLAGTICVRPGVWASPLEKVSLRSQSVRALGAIWLMSAVS